MPVQLLVVVVMGSLHTRTRLGTVQDRDLALDEARRTVQSWNNYRLSNELSGLAQEPRRLDPISRKAVLMAAASRLWEASHE